MKEDLSIFSNRHFDLRGLAVFRCYKKRGLRSHHVFRRINSGNRESLKMKKAMKEDLQIFSNLLFNLQRLAVPAVDPVDPVDPVSSMLNPPSPAFPLRRTRPEEQPMTPW